MKFFEWLNAYRNDMFLKPLCTAFEKKKNKTKQKTRDTVAVVIQRKHEVVIFFVSISEKDGVS